MFFNSAQNGIMRKKSEHIRKSCHGYSLWNYNRTTHTLTICTTAPGWWIGKGGEGIDSLRDELNERIRTNREIVKSRYKDNKINPEYEDWVDKIIILECEG